MLTVLTELGLRLHQARVRLSLLEGRAGCRFRFCAPCGLQGRRGSEVHCGGLRLKAQDRRGQSEANQDDWHLREEWG